MAAIPVPPVSEEEYLAFERNAEFKHELVKGQIRAMVGASLVHSILVANAIALLKLKLPDGCRAVGSDLRVRIGKAKSYVYPDMVVFCGSADLLDNTFDTLENPIAIIEVLSPSTETYDRGEKFELYRKLDSIES